MVLAVWLGTGLRVLDPQTEFGVLDGPLPWAMPRVARGRVALAPPGLLTLYRYPLAGVELPLPQADEALIPAPNGSRFGFRGFITVRARPEEWRALHAASGGQGIRGALLTAARRAVEGAPPGDIAVASTLAHSLERRFRDELGRIGIDLRRFDFEALDFLAASSSDPAPRVATKLLVVGLDGADWSILDPLIAAGRLPNLAALIERGTRAKLLSISPLLSPVIWTTVATGVEPGRHGVLDFLVEEPGAPGSQQPVTSAQRQVPTVWEILSRSGIEVGVTGWWATWPADPVRGFLVSDRVAYQLFGYRADPADARGKTWPPDLYSDVRERIVAPDAVGWDQVTPYLDGPAREPASFDAEERELLEGLRTLLASGETYLRVHQALAERFRPQLEVVYFEGTDTIGHLFMPYRPPLLPAVDPARAATFATVVDRYYETADRYLGQLLAGRGGDWTVMVLSDHGFATDATRPRTTDSRIGHGAAADWHRRFGILILSGAHVRPGRLDEASVYDIAPTVLALFGQPVPRSWPGKILAGAIDPGFLARHPVRFLTDDPERRDPGAAIDVAGDPGAADLIEKLASLGYVSAGGAGGASVTARNNAGVAMLGEGRFVDAEREFRAGLAADPAAAMLRFNLGLALRYQGRLDEAGTIFEETLDVPSTMRMAGQQLVQMRLDAGDLDAAEGLARRVLESEPDSSEVHYLLGRALEQRGDLAGASEAWQRAADLDPDVALPRNALGNLARGKGRLDEAESWYLRAIEADPYFMGSYNNLALIYQDRGEMDRALDLYVRALAKAPNNAELLNNVGSWHYAKGEFDEARKLWSRATVADATYASPLNNLAGLAIHAGRFEEAAELLSRALVLDPDYADARINLAIAHRARGDVDGARAELVRATAAPSADETAWLELGFLELEGGYVDAAIAAFEEAGRRAPSNLRALNGLGEAWRLKGRNDLAAELWQRSLALDPRQPQLRQSLEALPRIP